MKPVESSVRVSDAEQFERETEGKVAEIHARLAKLLGDKPDKPPVDLKSA